MRQVLVIGMGAGSPNHMTLEAVAALKQADVVLALDKGDEKADLLSVRREILSAHHSQVPLVTVIDPPRDRDPENYREEVLRWHDRRAQVLEEALLTHTGPDGVAAFLVWGDPSLYDSTLRILDRFSTPIAITVIPGITAVQALTAAHAILLNRIGEEIVITTGRNLTKAANKNCNNCVVMLDGGAAWLTAATPTTYMWWGAYLGTDKQVLKKGYVAEIGEEVATLKAELKARHGWIMDIYLLRNQPQTGAETNSA